MPFEDVALPDSIHTFKIYRAYNLLLLPGTLPPQLPAVQNPPRTQVSNQRGKYKEAQAISENLLLLTPVSSSPCSQQEKQKNLH